MRLVVATALLGLVPGAPAAAQRATGWEVRVAERVEVAVGSQGTIPISIAVDRGLSVSRDATVIVDLAGDPGVVLKKNRLGRGDAVDPDADAPRFAAVVRADAEGEHAVKIRVRFWLCGRRVCKPIDARRSALVAVGPAAPAP